MTKQALIVDDDKDVLLVWAALIRDCGLEPVEAVNGREAMDKLNSDAPFDLVMMDQMMPFVNGAEVLKFIREHERRKTVPVILSTANRSTQMLAEGPTDGLTSYVNKASGLDKLRRAITQALGTDG